MGSLLHLVTRRSVYLNTRQLVGRSRRCDLSVRSRMASGEHAILWWSEGSWYVRDLGSTNGTWVDGIKLAVGQAHRLVRGTLLAFGDPDTAWRMSSDTPPTPRVVNLDTGEAVDSAGPFVALPSPEEPTVSVYWADGAWVSDHDGELTELTDRTVITVDGQRFQLDVPDQLDGTVVDSDMLAISEHHLHRFRFVFRPLGSDQWCMDVERRNGALGLRRRSHHTTLYRLAALRLADIDAGRAEHEAGWVTYSEFARQLNLDLRTLRVHIHRGRQQLAKHGVCGADLLVERRSDTKKLRFGGSTITVVDD